MKTFSPGLSDSIAGVLDEPTPCPHCQSSSQIAGGLCVGCLLEAGLDAADETESETLTDILAEVRLADQNWRLGNYEILEEIGRGGMGVIYRARQRHSRRIVAVKRVLSYHADSRETLARFRREAQAAASLDHPNILPIFEVSESEDGLPFFSMKFAPGGTLQQVAPAIRKDPRQCVALVAKITRAVQYAHSRGVLHRDLKPGNILLDGRGEPLVSDFGLAKWLDTSSDLTRTLTIFGTPGYIAPEQASAAAADLKPTADIYSLGAILFDLLAGRPPFLGAHALSVIGQAAESPAPKLRTLTKLADRDLETICSRCLEREPKLRYLSAHDLAEDLERWLEGRSITARPVAAPVRIWRWARRNPKLAGSLVSILVLASVGIVSIVASSRLSSIVQEAEIAQHTIAIMPLEDLSELSNSSSATDFLNALTATLKAAKGIYPRPLAGFASDRDPWSPQHWKQIGRASRARFVLNGSVRPRQATQRLVLRIIDTATGAVIRTWLSDGDSSSKVAKRLPTQVAAVINNAKRNLPDADGSLLMVNGDVNSVGGTDNAEARSYYERGKELHQRYNFPDLVRAIDSFRKAIEIDSAYAQPHAILGTLYGLMALQPGGEWLAQADEETAIALKLAPMLPESRLAHGEVLARHGQLHASIDECVTAYELDPCAARIAAKVGDSYFRTGRADLAIRWYEKAMRRDARPLYADILGDAWTDLGDFEKAQASYETAAVFRPDLPSTAAGFARLALFRGNHDQARKQSEAARSKYKDNPQPVMTAALVEFFTRHFDAAERFYRDASKFGRNRGVDFPGCVRFTSALGFIQQLSAERASEGTALLEESLAVDQEETASAPENPRSWYSLAADESALGNKEAALTALERSIEMGWIDYHSMNLDPRFDSIRAAPRFQQAFAQLEQTVRHMAERTKQ
jgi:tetratricopeptide (TPR) repeat protein/TolB-like protein/tRNA A-37 threonylcarbamoyl transferase component Bud32